ncbi:MAG: glutathione binding-like protein [Albidovulum sp.]|nr:glutathione binding-like protein [Albidovulum sp.]MDE0533595.1 glutathione binding-like protein [Albidovulum sp.]
MTLHLYCFGESGNAYKAALTLELCGIPWTPVFVDFFNGETRTPEFRKLNPMGEVPVLVGDGLKLSQSGAIQDYAMEMSGRLRGSGPGERREILRWILWDNHKMSSYCGIARFLQNFIPEEKRPLEVIDWLRGRMQGGFSTLERELSNRDWLVGEEPSAADLACCGYLFYPEPFGFDRKDWPAVDAWLERIEDLTGWRHPYDLMPGRPSDRMSKSK